jgi:hypothetical protein
MSSANSTEVDKRVFLPRLFICAFVTNASDALSFIIKPFGNITLRLFQDKFKQLSSE